MDFDFYKKGRDPDFINDIGTKWWRQETHFNKEKSENLESKGYSCWYVETIDDDRNHVVIKNEEIVFSTKQLEAVAVWIDCAWLSEKEY